MREKLKESLSRSGKLSAKGLHNRKKCDNRRDCSVRKLKSDNGKKSAWLLLKILEKLPPDNSLKREDWSWQRKISNGCLKGRSMRA